MKDYSVKDIRNIAVLGHGSEGKTTLVESMLFSSGAIDRQGRVEEGNTVSDYDPEEVKRHIFVSRKYRKPELIEGFKEHPFIMQEYIAVSGGRDVRINVVGGRVVASMYRYNDNDFRSNITNGGSMKKYDADPAQAEIAVKACEAIGLDFAGVDVLFGEDGPIICEVNSNPHFKTTLECTGINMAEHIMAHILKVMNGE